MARTQAPKKIPYFLALPLAPLMVAGFLLSYYHIPFSDLFSYEFYQNLANPSVRMIYIQEGWRKEQVAESVGDKLGWNDQEKSDFLNAHIALGKETSEGFYFPKNYAIQKDTKPEDVSEIMINEYDKKTSEIKRGKTMKILNEDTALIVASIIQREAAGKHDMNIISGIIWNRIFLGMKLQMDATLQYAKGDEDLWWPQVKSEDKYIVSPYNTYKNKSLPPTAIANPGIAALTAAYNPQKTSCIFYLHDKKRKIHCAKTYEEHKQNIEKYL
ncbi:MAG: endolytic transglycosylase MltG [Candidatus Zambryskibacteria bacterium]|nr:endolytic transglycosylase MltG [Candidatus Zambryskibacteria bacterium]